MTFTVRKARCVECPLTEENLSHLNIPQAQNLLNSKAIFPCHMEMRKVIGKDNTGVEEYVEKVDTFITCRGYIETLKHLNVKPFNPIVAKLYEEVS